jgi:hypothetical protein
LCVKQNNSVFLQLLQNCKCPIEALGAAPEPLGANQTFYNVCRSSEAMEEAMLAPAAVSLHCRAALHLQLATSLLTAAAQPPAPKQLAARLHHDDGPHGDEALTDGYQAEGAGVEGLGNENNQGCRWQQVGEAALQEAASASAQLLALLKGAEWIQPAGMQQLMTVLCSSGSA